MSQVFIVFSMRLETSINHLCFALFIIYGFPWPINMQCTSWSTNVDKLKEKLCFFFVCSRKSRRRVNERRVDTVWPEFSNWHYLLSTVHLPVMIGMRIFKLSIWTKGFVHSSRKWLNWKGLGTVWRTWMNWSKIDRISGVAWMFLGNRQVFSKKSSNLVQKCFRGSKIENACDIHQIKVAGGENEPS